ncbi:MAG: SDR family NAD(P)-dependent oxidoreductase [Micavibrio sp.]
MTKTLEGKVALVTGGSRGMGADIAKKLAARGANVVLTYSASPDRAHEVVNAIKAVQGNAIAIKADSGKVEDVQQAIRQTVSTFGALDILVNNAGIMIKEDVAAYTMDDFDRMLDVNVKAIFVGVQEALKHMKAGGRIINIGSIMSDYAIFPTASVYTMTKAAVAGLTRGLARDLGPRGITINNVQPGPVDTDMNPADGPAADMMRSMMPVGRFGTGADIAHVVAFLASPDSSFITGAQIHVDGGATA